jgi:hypothetical protein
MVVVVVVLVVVVVVVLYVFVSRVYIAPAYIFHYTHVSHSEY